MISDDQMCQSHHAYPSVICMVRSDIGWDFLIDLNHIVSILGSSIPYDLSETFWVSPLMSDQHTRASTQLIQFDHSQPCSQPLIIGLAAGSHVIIFTYYF